MSYRPKYCCQCGETIERIDWKPWTSRRFCELCETEFGIYDWLSRGLFGIGLLLGLFGIGIYLQKPERQISVAPKQFAAAPTAKSDGGNQKIAPQSSTSNNIPAQTENVVSQTKTETPPDLKIKPVEIPPSEKIYFCGATTKKGTMCSRRVKGGGRCWQHIGQTAMLPQEKLLASQ
ncbi:MAG: hypothetical protein ACR2HG_06495 [Pyrinomonadaceae bacterium]